MGAINFIEFGKGDTAITAFDQLVAEAEWEHGHDPYNGTISTTSLVGKPVKVAEKWGEWAREMAIQEADEHGWGEKWESRAIDCGEFGETRMWAFYGWASC